MKKNIGILLVILLLALCSCGTPQKLDFPKTTWNMTSDQVMEVYQIKQEDAAIYRESGRSLVFALENQEVFGEMAQTVQFNFMDVNLENGEDIRISNENEDNEKKLLCGVTIVYSQNSDMNKVEKHMEKLYGDEHLSEISVFSSFDVLGTGELNEIKHTETDEIKLWGSETVARATEEEKNVAFQKKWVSYLPGLKEERWEEFSERGRLITVVLNKNGENPSVKFDGYNQLIYQEIKDVSKETSS